MQNGLQNQLLMHNWYGTSMSSFSGFFTNKEEFGNFKNVVLTFVGDGNNVANSLILCGALLNLEIRIACPRGYEPNENIIQKALQIYEDKSLLKINNNPESCVIGANVIYTDVWSSMGEENQRRKR